MDAFRTVRLLPALLIGLFCVLLSSCTVSRHTSLLPDIEQEFLYRSAEDIVLLMGGQPDAIESNERGRTLVYQAHGYVKDRYQDENIKTSGNKFIRLFLDEKDACYLVQTNLQRKDVRLDKKKTLDGVFTTLDSILMFFYRDRYWYSRTR